MFSKRKYTNFIAIIEAFRAFFQRHTYINHINLAKSIQKYYICTNYATRKTYARPFTDLQQ